MAIFPPSHDVCGMYLMFCAQFSFDLVTLIFDLLTFAVCDELSFAFPVHISIFTILQLSVPELCVTQFDHITITWYGHINLGNYQIIINSGMQQVFDQLICIFDVSALKLIAS